MEDNESIQQQRRWPKEVFGYDFSIVQRFVTTMKDVNVLSRNINLLFNQYLVTTSLLYWHALKSIPFAFNYNMLHSCSNPCHMQVSATILVLTSSSVSTSSTL